MTLDNETVTEPQHLATVHPLFVAKADHDKIDPLHDPVHREAKIGRLRQPGCPIGTECRLSAHHPIAVRIEPLGKG